MEDAVHWLSSEEIRDAVRVRRSGRTWGDGKGQARAVHGDVGGGAAQCPDARCSGR